MLGLGAFIFYAMMVAAAVASLSEVYGELQRAAGATERLIELLQQPSNIVSANNLEMSSDIAAEFHLSNLSFAYPSRLEKNALQDFSLSIKEGEVLALVGPSGSGKSTIFELLQRFYDPQKGDIHLGHATCQKNIKQFNLQQLRELIGVVSQQPVLFSEDVMYNIRYGRLDATDDEVIAAAKSAHAHEFITQLPQGYSSDLGEKGVRLSGGQRQRVAIARAILKNPKILLLDEATSALDAQSEAYVQEALEKLMKNRTTVIIAHRLSTILHADTIAVIDQGKLVAQGKHETLIQDNPLYQQLAKLQFQSL